MRSAKETMFSVKQASLQLSDVIENFMDGRYSGLCGAYNHKSCDLSVTEHQMRTPHFFNACNDFIDG